MTAFRPDFGEADIRPSPNFGVRRDVARPGAIILHYTGMRSGAAAEDWLCDTRSEVSSHYLVHENGRVVQMVREADRAWHAGASSWRGCTDINSLSIGVEIVNPGHEFGYRDFPDAQIAAVIALCRDIVARHAIRPWMVLAHSDVAPGRKVDPGERFPWSRLAACGVGQFVAPSPIVEGTAFAAGDEGGEVSRLQSMLARYGYGIEPTGCYDARTVAVMEAFQRHFRPARVDGRADRSSRETLRRLIGSLGDEPQALPPSA